MRYLRVFLVVISVLVGAWIVTPVALAQKEANGLPESVAKQFPTKPIAEWAGEKVVFLRMASNLRHYGYQMYRKYEEGEDED